MFCMFKCFDLIFRCVLYDIVIASKPNNYVMGIFWSHDVPQSNFTANLLTLTPIDSHLHGHNINGLSLRHTKYNHSMNVILLSTNLN